jgi:hypothetical protein
VYQVLLIRLRPSDQLGSCWSIFLFVCSVCRLVFVRLSFSFGHCFVCTFLLMASDYHYYELRDIHYIYRCSLNATTYKWKVHICKNHLFCVLNQHSLSICMCRSMYETDLAVYVVSFSSNLMG